MITPAHLELGPYIYTKPEWRAQAKHTPTPDLANPVRSRRPGAEGPKQKARRPGYLEPPGMRTCLRAPMQACGHYIRQEGDGATRTATAKGAKSGKRLLHQSKRTVSKWDMILVELPSEAPCTLQPLQVAQLGTPISCSESPAVPRHTDHQCSQGPPKTARISCLTRLCRTNVTQMCVYVYPPPGLWQQPLRLESPVGLAHLPALSDPPAWYPRSPHVQAQPPWRPTPLQASLLARAQACAVKL